MLSICTDFAREYLVTFKLRRPLESVGVHSWKSEACDGVAVLDGVHMEWKANVKHLGKVVAYNLSGAVDCNYKQSGFIGQVNRLIANFSHVYYFLTGNNSFHLSVPPFMIPSSGISAARITELPRTRQSVISIPNQSHSWMLGPLINMPNVKCQLFCRAMNFIQNTSWGEYKFVKTFIQLI